MKPGSSAQKKISSFFTAKPKPASGDGPSSQAGSSAGARTAGLATPKRPSEASELLPAAKRTKQSGASTPSADAAPKAAAVSIPVRDVTRAAKAQKKLVTNKDGEHVFDPTVTSQPMTPASTSKGAHKGTDKGVKLTPLEQQVVDLKAKHPDVLLVIEVGYKFRAFGEDAEACARICNIYAFPDHNFLTCSFPVFRLPVYVRRLVNAGLKVGVVRQVETAAIKSQSSSRNLPFERRLTGLYTAATLDAGQKADKAGEEGSLEEFAELDAATMNGGAKPKYVLFVSQQAAGAGAGGQQREVCELLSSDDEEGAEEEQGQHKAIGRSKAGKAAVPRPVSRAAGGVAQGPELALLAVEPSTGDVQLGLASTTSVLSKSEATSEGALELEGVLLSLAPIEVVVLDPVSPAVNRMLQAYVSSTSGCRMDRLRGWGAACTPDQLTPQLQTLYPGAPDRLSSAQALPLHAQRALAGASSYLGEFGLEGVMRPPAQLSAATQGLEHGNSCHVQHVVAAGLRPLAAHRCMALGPNALRQLEVLTSSDGGHQGSLLHLLDRTSTAAGGRLLRSWVAAPLTDAALINARLDAVEELAGVKSSRSSTGPLSRVPDTLRRLPDLERGLTRLLHRTAPPAELVATLTALKEVATHLDLTYDPTSGSLQPLDPSWIASPLLASLISSAAAPEAHHACVSMLGKLDVAAARANRTADCLTDPELFADVAAAKADVQKALAALQSLLPTLAKQLGVRALDYVSIQNQGDWLIEVPVEQERKVPKDWSRVCGTKKVGRYHPPSVQEGMLALAIARETLASTAAGAYTRLLECFAQHYQACKVAALALAQLDVLSSLAAVARTPGYCRPKVQPSDTTAASSQPATSTPASTGFLPASQGEPGGQVQQPAARLVIKAGRHPMLDAQLSGGAGARLAGGAAAGTGAVPNDITLDGNGVRAAIITGPNMGGKSCLIRQAALIAIMAQVGSFVPADSCHMTVLDGVFTRMGASDNLLLGRSTFMEELSDAAHILSRASSRSLVIMDELGRGTATHDGVAIATATLSHLITHIQCLSLFVTHYPEVSQLCDSHAGHVRAYHMAYVQQGDEEDEEADEQHVTAGGQAGGSTSTPAMQSAGTSGPGQGPQQQEAGDVDMEAVDSSGGKTAAGTSAVPTITFLYKLREGQADQSFGLNVARMAGLPASVISRAADKAAELQVAARDTKAINLMRHVVTRIRECMAATSADVSPGIQSQMAVIHQEVVNAMGV